VLFCELRWKDEDEIIEKQVAAAEHLSKDWLMYNNECEEVETSLNKLESELDDVIADTEPEHLQTCLDQLQVSA